MYTVFMKKVVYLEGSFESEKYWKSLLHLYQQYRPRGMAAASLLSLNQSRAAGRNRQERAEQHLCSEFQVPEDGEGAAGRGHQCPGHDQAHYKKNRNFHRLKEKPTEIKQFLSARASRRKLLW
jgi:hypothetical protein